MHRYLTAALVTLAACAAEPPTSTASEDLCQRDPVTGGCKSGLDPNDAQSVARAWVHDNYPSSTVSHVDCGRFSEPSTGRSGTGCATTFTFFGTRYVAGCLFFDDGGVDCGVEETD